MKDQLPVPKDFFERLWKINVYLLRAKFKKWINQRCYFIAAEDSFPWRVLEAEIKDPDHLPKDHLIVNAIYTGVIWRRPERGWFGEAQQRYTVLEFRDVLYEWTNRKDEQCQMTCLSETRNKNKKRTWSFTIEEVFTGGLTLKKMRTGFDSTGGSLAEGSPLKQEPSVPRSQLAVALEDWEKATNDRRK